MRKRIKAFSFVLTLLLALVLVPAMCLAAAQPADKPQKMLINAYIANPKFFWSYPYITRDGFSRMPAAVQVVWSTSSGLESKKAIVIQTGKDKGQVEISSEKNAYIDIELQVIDAKKVVLGKSSLQVRNNGKDVSFVVYPPEITTPTIELAN
jgi:ABC-type sugar transport system substrate-binding protein